MISKEEVILAYRLILGREPENGDVVDNYCHTVSSIQNLRELFMNSPEFIKKISERLDNPKLVRQRHPFNLPNIPVEINASRETLDLMFNRGSDTWEHMGFTEPYWSVITQDQYKINNFSKNSENFYSSGGPLFRDILSILKRNGINYMDLDNCLEIGCGVGRMTKFLAETFRKVIAVDISAQHLTMAKNYISAESIDNCEFIHINNLEKFDQFINIDFVISVITLQHNPPPVISWVLKKLLESLRPSGIAFFQIPTYRSGYIFEIERYLNRDRDNKIEMHFLPQENIFKIIDESGCICIESREDSMVGDETNTLSKSFLVRKK